MNEARLEHGDARYDRLVLHSRCIDRKITAAGDARASSLCALTPLDGRYRYALSELRALFSEYAFVRARLHVEVEYLVALAQQLDHVPSLKALRTPDGIASSATWK